MEYVKLVCMGSCDVLALYFRLTRSADIEHRGASAIHQSNIPVFVVYLIFLN